MILPALARNRPAGGMSGVGLRAAPIVVSVAPALATSAAITPTVDAGSVTPIADFDFSAPVTAYDFSSAHATDEWLMQELSGSYSNNAGTATLANNGGLQGREAIGFFDGTDLVSRKAWECDADTEYLECSDAAVGDINGNDLCARIVFRGIWSASNDYLLAKRGGSFGSAGWGLYTTTLGRLVFYLSKGGGQYTTTLTAQNLNDGAWHSLTFFYDDSLDRLSVKIDGTEVLTNADVSSQTGDKSTATALQINKAGDSLGISGNVQVGYLSLCDDANAASMYGESFWTHATDPTGLLETVSRASAISIPVSASRVAHFSVDQLPIGYHSAFDAGTFALYANSDVTNLLTYSELLSNWTAKSGTPTVTDRAGDAPDGFRRATSITAGAANDQQGLDFATVASTEYTLSVWVRRNGASDVAGRLVFYNETGATQLAAQAFTATDTWQLVSVTATTTGSQVSSSIRVEVDTSTESVFAWGAQANTGVGRGAYIRTEGATATLAECDFERTTEDVIVAAEGELLAVWVWALDPPAGSSSSYIYAQAHTTLAENRELFMTPAGLMNVAMYQGGASEANHIASATHNPVPTDQKITTAHQWGASLSSTEMRLIVDGNNEDEAETQPYENTAGSTHEGIQIGNARGASLGLNGWIQSIKSYDELVTVGV